MGLGTLATKGLAAVRTMAGRATSTLEGLLTDGSDTPMAHPPIFILGAPRSGTTLLYQSVTTAFDVGFLTNTHCRFVNAPALAEAMLGRFRTRPQASFESDFGRTNGAWGPSECGAFWYRFFPHRPQYVGPEQASPRQMRKMRGCVRALGNAFARPIVFKNLPCALRLQALTAALPEALFVILERDIEEVARSLMHARLTLRGSAEAWWSVEVPEFTALQSLPPEAQVVEQARSVYALIHRDLGNHSARTCTIDYETLCEHPNAAMDQIDAFAQSHGISLARQEHTFLPRFSVRRTEGLDPAWSERIAAYLGHSGGRVS